MDTRQIHTHSIRILTHQGVVEEMSHQFRLHRSGESPLLHQCHLGTLAPAGGAREAVSGGEAGSELCGAVGAGEASQEGGVCVGGEGSGGSGVLDVRTV